MVKTPQYRPITLDLSRKSAPTFFARAVERGLADGIAAFQLRSARGAVYPNAAVPIAGLVDHYRKAAGVRFISSRSIESDGYLRRAGMLDPYSDPSSVPQRGFADKVWMFTADTHYDIVSGIMDTLRAAAPASRGILRCLELSFNEVTDNVLNHSLEGAQGEPVGFAMAQVHRRERRIALTVFDAGVGIPRTLAAAYPELEDPELAIPRALEKGVTSGAGKGNGLWILERIVAGSGGSLEVTSDGTRYTIRHDECGEETGGREAAGVISKASRVVPGTTTVDFQLRLDRPLEISSVLDGFEPVDLWTEAREDEDGSSMRLVMREESRGFGTRVAARQMRTLVANVLADTDGTVVLDFEGADVMSTSYADELVAKLARDRRYSERIALANLGEDARRAIAAVADAPLRVLR